MQITLKDPAVFHRRFTLNGVLLDCAKNQVAPSEKLAKKMCVDLPPQTTYGLLESYMARRIYAAAIQQRPLVADWFAIKWHRRRLSELASGKKVVSDSITIPPGVWSHLQASQKVLLSPHTVEKITGRGKAHLFTDASQWGYGAVLFHPDGRFSIVGNKWSKNDLKLLQQQQPSSTSSSTTSSISSSPILMSSSSSLNINVLESLAVEKAISTLKTTLDTFEEVVLHIDNTSVQFAIQKGNSRAESMAPYILRNTELMTPSTRWSVSRVTSESNPSDSFSREELVSILAQQQKLRIVYEQPLAAVNENERGGRSRRVVYSL
jgi:hypothetical protein